MALNGLTETDQRLISLENAIRLIEVRLDPLEVQVSTLTERFDELGKRLFRLGIIWGAKP